ncbi:hypothetical protein LXL04_024516 [Taraxacum kok-saghyz]
MQSLNVVGELSDSNYSIFSIPNRCSTQFGDNHVQKSVAVICKRISFAEESCYLSPSQFLNDTCNSPETLQIHKNRFVNVTIASTENPVSNTPSQILLRLIHSPSRLPILIRISYRRPDQQINPYNTHNTETNHQIFLLRSSSPRRRLPIAVGISVGTTVLHQISNRIPDLQSLIFFQTANLSTKAGPQ